MTSSHSPILLDGLSPAPEAFIVAALIYLPDGRYLMQLRDDKPGLPLPDHWALFGGEVEPGEDGVTAARREIEEELLHRADSCEWYHEAIYVLPRKGRRVVRKAFYLIPVEAEDVSRMELHEGSDMRLFTVDELLRLPRIAPWDLAVVLMHARERAIFPE